MDEARALASLRGILETVDQWGDLYNRRWGKNGPDYHEDVTLRARVEEGIDQVRAQTRLAHDIVRAMGEGSLSSQIMEHEEGMYGGHPFTQARVALVEAIAILTQREELAAIIGPVGPQLSATQLHPVIWGAAARLWDDGHVRAAVQTAATALEGLLQSFWGPHVAGENLAALFSTKEPTADSPRLRLRDLEPTSRTWTSLHEGAAAMARGAFLAVRNAVSHPGWPDPTPSEGLEMLAVLSFVAQLTERSDLVTPP